MDLNQYRCKNCGGNLTPSDDQWWSCKYCGSVFANARAEQHANEMKQMFDEAKQEAINNLRRNLYDAVNAEYVSSQEVHNLCNQLKQYLPDDFQANFYEVMVGSNIKQATKAIRQIDVEKQQDYVEGIIKFLIRSLQPAYLLEVNNLIERAYKQSNLAKFEEYSTALSREAEKVQLGIYETKLPREVFVAYSSKDMDKVEALVEVLEAQGMKCFVAARNLRHGKGAVENYDKALKDAMDHCKSFVFVSSRNSRSLSCDALEIEIPYIQHKDIENAPAEYRNNYIAIPHRYKKPRVEFRVEESTHVSAADTITNEFFDGYERVYSADEVALRIMKQLLGTDEEPVAPAPKAPAAEAPKKYCAECGQENPVTTKFCAECGSDEFVDSVAEFIKLKNAESMEKFVPEPDPEPIPAPTPAPAVKAKPYKPSRIVNDNAAMLLCVFLGIFGAHRFYVGKKATGVLYLLTFGFFGIGPIVDLITFNKDNFKTKEGHYVFPDKGVKIFGTICFIIFVVVFLAIIGNSSGSPSTNPTDTKPIVSQDGNQVNGDEASPEGLTFTEDEGGWTVSVAEADRTKVSGDVVIPDSYNGMAVVKIADKAFANCTAMTSITVPNSVTYIGAGAFTGCTKLQSVTLPFVGQSATATKNESLLGHVFGTESYTGGNAIKQRFDGETWNATTFYLPMQLTSVTITGAQTIAPYAFWNCTSLKTVELNEDLISIGTGAFMNCSSLTTLTIPNGVTAIPDSLVSGCVALKSFYFNADAVTSIGASAWHGCAALEMLNSEESGVFLLSDTVGSIGSGAFSGCAKMKSITLPFVGQSPTATKNDSLFGYIFGTTSYTSGTATVQRFDGETWNATTYYLPAQLTSVTITNAETIAAYAFWNCSNLKTINLNDGIISVGDYAFQNCSSIKEISLPNITAVSAGLMYGCSSLESFTINSSVTSVGSSAFGNCHKLARLNSEVDGHFVVPNWVTSIGSSAFNGCTKMTTLSIPFVGNTATSEKNEGLFGYIFGTTSYTGGTPIQQRYDGETWNATTYYIPSQLRKVIVTNASQLVNYAFWNCSQLTAIYINTAAQTGTAQNAFLNCSVTPVFTDTPDTEDVVPDVGEETTDAEEEPGYIVETPSLASSSNKFVY